MGMAMMISQPAGLATSSSGTGKHEVGVVAQDGMAQIEQHSAWPMLSQIRMTMRAELPLDRFRVRDLLALAVGQVFETVSPDTEDVPIRIGNVQLGWGEFEVVEQRIALRLTRLD